MSYYQAEAETPGRRDIGLCFTGDSFIVGYGDPKALGWVSRVLGHTPMNDLDLTAYNLGVRGESSTDLLARWRAECDPRWAGRGERRLVIGVGHQDVVSGLSTARSRLNLANVLDDAAAAGIATFVVGPPPSSDDALTSRLEVLSDAQGDVCSRRGVPFVDCFHPLLDHAEWSADLAAGDGVHPGQAGYRLIAWLVMHSGWSEWLGV